MQYTPNKHPGGTQETPRTTQEAPTRPGHLGVKMCVFIFVVVSNKGYAMDHFRDDPTPAHTITPPAHKISWPQRAKIGEEQIPNAEDTPPETL